MDTFANTIPWMSSGATMTWCGWGAAAGSLACIANVIECLPDTATWPPWRMATASTCLPLATFALETYENTNCDAFTIKFNTDYNTKDLGLDTKMHKAIAILQFKLEGQLDHAAPGVPYGRPDAVASDRFSEKDDLRGRQKTIP